MNTNIVGTVNMWSSERAPVSCSKRVLSVCRSCTSCWMVETYNAGLVVDTNFIECALFSCSSWQTVSGCQDLCRSPAINHWSSCNYVCFNTVCL